MLRMHRLALATVTFAMIFSGAARAADTEVRTEWYHDRCPKGLPLSAEEAPQKFAPIFAALVAVIAPKVVEGGIDFAAKRLQAAGEDRPSVKSGRTDGYFYSYLRERKNVLDSRCLIIVEAENFSAPLSASEPHPWRASTKRVGGYQNPKYIFMATVELAPEGKFFRLVPTYFEVTDWRESSVFNREHRNYNFAVTTSALGGDKPIASVSFNFKDIQRGHTYTATDELLASAVTDFVPLPPLSQEGTKHVNAIETAWAPKDKAASILDTKMAFANRDADIAAGKVASPMPELYRSPYIEKLRDYCSSVRNANRDVEKSKREIPKECNWEVDQRLEQAESAKKSVERSPEWIAWAQRTCWHDPAERATEVALPHPDGHKCSTPGSIEDAAKSHTQVATIAAVTEVIPGSKTAKFLGDSLAANAAELSKPIVDHLPPLTKEARNAEDAAERALNQAVVENDYKVQLAEAELAELPENAPQSQITDKRMKRQAAWYAANNAYRAAGRVPPYPET